MSNYNFEHLKGFDDLIVVGSEVVNGTGEVQVRMFQAKVDPERGEFLPCGCAGRESVFRTLTADQALDFARLLADRAHDAMRAKFVNDKIDSG